jgi:hypothetical protein
MQDAVMKMLTATKIGQGIRANDYSHTTEGELVLVGLVCATDRKNPDGGCGCGRGFSGLSSHRATTTAQVRDLPMSREDVILAFVGYYKSAGYGIVPRNEVEPEVDELLQFAGKHDTGTIIERRLDLVRPRL